MQDVREIGRLLKQLSDKLEATANADLKKIDLTVSQSRILLYLDEQSGKQATQRELEAHLKVSHATVHGLLARMEAKGLVQVETSSEDRRMRIVRLNANDSKLAEIRAQQRNHMTRLTEGMDTGLLLQQLQALLDNHTKYFDTKDGE